ncbi:glutamate--tRNA ligase [Buchnera aphidicola (Thelaxes californica)]|uniref:Glutamate--tRNA ligase n=1 Tax=Buchnera aphidicola (Thelaxes californica) TaxID=1315998 RepID=A0A4D6YEY4_9GAMM|nr:glutamate--tRNA ligase [Buchnera aphidicola]QCI26613.1 glutamate--tRNA ligase [Buchnera aphidicola (Thelaxes californica)]
MKVVTRFAPSPTGLLHIGNIRTALYAWLFAKHYSGKFILRIEDTNFNTSNQKYSSSILDVLNWLGLSWDEGPYFQSHNLKFYNDIILQLITQKKAYKCYCSSEHLKKIRDVQIINGDKPKYDGTCKNITKDLCKPYVVRFKNPERGRVIFQDCIRGNISVNNEELDDLIIQRTNGIPTYNFCSVIDDHRMNITHVIRGEDHINNTPRQINIYKSLNFKIPQYAHVSMIIDKNKQKLSKRNKNYEMTYYQNQGFFPEALLNYIVRLGWSHGNQEIFSLNEMIKLFSLKKVNKAPSIFNTRKLLWINHYYLNTLPEKYVVIEFKKLLKKKKINIHFDINQINIIRLLKKRCSTINEIIDGSKFFYSDFHINFILLSQNYVHKLCKNITCIFFKKFYLLQNWSILNIQRCIKNTIVEQCFFTKDVYMNLRIILTGSDISPSIIEIIFILGKTLTLKRIKNCIQFIKNN